MIPLNIKLRANDSLLYLSVRTTEPSCGRSCILRAQRLINSRRLLPILERSRLRIIRIKFRPSWILRSKGKSSPIMVKFRRSRSSTPSLQDADGIDITPSKTIVKIDNRVLPTSQYTILDSSRTMTTVNLTMQPSLSPGTHTITIQTTDNDGLTNTPPKELDVRVSNQFSVTILGSFPDPFTGVQMFIAYQINGIAYAQSVSLDIYTVSGRRIRTMSYPSTDPTRAFGFLQGGTGTPTSIGYHEVWWNGLDDGGSECANGVYFYRLTVTTPSSTQELKGKFARLR